LDLDVQDIACEEERTPEEKHMPQKWEYRVIEITDRSRVQSELTQVGAGGWELVSATAMFNTMMTKVFHTLFLKRPRP
jgi:hypothetical protein